MSCNTCRADTDDADVSKASVLLPVKYAGVLPERMDSGCVDKRINGIY